MERLAMTFQRPQVFAISAAATLVWAAAVVTPAQLNGKAAKRTISFNRDVRPILSEHCFKCHGPSAKEGKGGLRLDDPASATKARSGYTDVLPGDASKSYIMQRLLPPRPEESMPPPDSGMKPLTPEEIDTIRLWIDQGAKYEKLWSLIPPTMPSMPVVSDKKWARNPIDLFILERLEANKLKPEPEADKPTLLRRASLTLTGLQPTPDELGAFLKDKSKDAFEKAVDRLLASPRHGEHEARYWLDAVRYGDTHGLHLDNERSIYPYRDWVVRAFNEDLSFDKFALWQLAGDLLPNPTTDKLVATGYVRMNPTTSEGGAIADEFQAKNTFDRVDTTSTVFLGMTVACARCHNHKYDPISQADYYRLFAFFNSTADEPLDGNALLPGPVAPAPTPEEDVKLQAMKKSLDGMEAKVDLKVARAWIESRRVTYPPAPKWEVSDEVQAKTFDEAFDTETPPTNWVPLDLKPDTPLEYFKKTNAYGYLRTTLSSTKDQDLGMRFSSDDGIKVWVNGTLVHQNKVLRAVNQSVDSVRIHLKPGDNEIIVKIVNSGGPGGALFGFGDDTDKKIEAVAKVQNKPEGVTELKRLYLLSGPTSPTSPTSLTNTYQARYKEYTEFLAKIPQSLVARELPMPRPAFVLRRGEYNLPTDPVNREIPKALGEMPKNAPLNRLGFAEWLTNKNHPLFARVFVNRLWQQHFGTGLVKTAEDFGNQGEWPSHPELLDYLAVKFVKDGFSVKKLNKLIVTSAAFRQNAFVNKDKFQADPENRLVSRGPRFRLDAEVLRDQALYASGLLFEKRGGHGFKPYQPAGLWEEVAFQESTTAKYTQDMTAEIYRRSLYLFWKRTSPHPVMLTFDAPMREMCVVRRARTNTPLQALVTMNEPAFFEAARAFGSRLAELKKTPAETVKFGFELATGRSPRPEESALFLKAYDRYLAKYRADPNSAKELLSVGMSPPDTKLPVDQLAAWTLVCSTLFNLDEFLTQH